MDEHGASRDDLTLPKGTSDADALAKQLQDDFDAGKELMVTVLKVNFFTPGTGQCLLNQVPWRLPYAHNLDLLASWVEEHALGPSG